MGAQAEVLSDRRWLRSSFPASLRCCESWISGTDGMGTQPENVSFFGGILPKLNKHFRKLELSEIMIQTVYLVGMNVQKLVECIYFSRVFIAQNKTL